MSNKQIWTLLIFFVVMCIFIAICIYLLPDVPD